MRGLISKPSSSAPSIVAPRTFSTGRGWLGRRFLARSKYSFVDRWRVDGTIEEVAELFLDTASLSRWWPQLSKVAVTRSGDEQGRARSFSTQAFGYLPYVLALEFHVVRVSFPQRFTVELTGDLRGHGGGNLRQDGGQVAIDLDLTIEIAHPLLHMLSLVARPALVAQHRWVMRQGEIGLKAALACREWHSAAVPL